jgi:long-chain acyl-CoA synthetase
MTEEDCYISYLPAAHSFEQCIFAMSCITGLKAGFFAGNVLKLTEDIAVLKPTLFPSVPRLFNRIYGKILDGTKAATGIKGWLVNKAIASKLANLKAGAGVTHGFYDKVVFKKMKAILGGNVKVMITGSAPISGEVLDFLKICFCCPITEGYGMTETMAGSCLTFPDDPQTGVVGGPLQCVKIRLRDIPEMGYLSSNDPPKGEVCFWGPSIMKGYFKNPEKTAEAFHNDWLLSGDVGMVLPNGNIKIIDRAKNIFKLSQGEYIAPEKLENVYVQSSFVMQCWIYGDSLRDHIVGFFVMDPDHIKKYC